MGMHVVVLDDDPAILRSLELLLCGLGHEVTAFRDPVAACDRIAEIPPPQVVILDWMMPSLNGREVLERIGKRLPVDCLVIFISGHTDSFDLVDLSWNGVYAFLPKPLDLDCLVRLVGASAGQKT